MLYTENPSPCEIKLEKAMKKLSRSWNKFQEATFYVNKEAREKMKKEAGEKILAARQAVYDASREFAKELNFECQE
jgi:hypothetical protein